MKIIDDSAAPFLSEEDYDYNTARSATRASISSYWEYIDCGQAYLPDRYGIPGNWYYRISRAMLFFDTSFLPTKYVINKAQVYLWCLSNLVPANQYLQMQMSTSLIPRGYPISTDFDRDHWSSDYGHVLSDNIVVDSWTCIDIPSSKLNCFNSRGFTMFCLRGQGEIDGIIPSDREMFTFGSSKSSSIHQPYLVLEIMPLVGDRTIVGDKVSLEAIRNIEIMNTGRFYISKDGKATYESRFHR